MTNPRQEIIDTLHAAFCRETGMKVTLDYGKRQSWAMWLEYRKGQDQFTEADLVFVIRSLQRQIIKREMFPEALNFYSFVAPDKFEIRLEQFRKIERNARKPMTNRDKILKATNRQVETMPEPKSVQILLTGEVQDMIAKLRKAAE